MQFFLDVFRYCVGKWIGCGEFIKMYDFTECCSL